MVKSMRQTIQFVPWTQMLTENAVSQFWGERAKVYPSTTDPPPQSVNAVRLVPGA